MAGFNLLVFLKYGPEFELSYFQNLLKRYQENQKGGALGKFVRFTDFIDLWKSFHSIKKRNIINWRTPCYAFYTLDGQWIENDLNVDWDRIVLDYFNSVEASTWLYLLHCKN